MANSFSFQMDEAFLRAYVTYLETIKHDTGKEHVVTISVELIPDGKSYSISGAPRITIDETPSVDILPMAKARGLPTSR